MVQNRHSLGRFRTELATITVTVVDSLYMTDILSMSVQHQGIICLLLPLKVTIQFETEGNGQNEIVSHMDR